MVSGEIRDPRIEKCFLIQILDSGPRFPDLNFRIWATLSDKKSDKETLCFSEKSNYGEQKRRFKIENRKRCNNPRLETTAR